MPKNCKSKIDTPHCTMLYSLQLFDVSTFERLMPEYRKPYFIHGLFDMSCITPLVGYVDAQQDQITNLKYHISILFKYWYKKL